MSWDRRFAMQANLFRLVCAWLLMTAVALAATASEHIRFAPKFSLGETLRYRIESRTKTTAKITTPIANPEGGSQSSQLISMLVRLDVLDVGRPTAASAGAVRLRATYERSSAQSEADAFDPAASSLADQYARIEGHSIEFTIEPDGQLANFYGLEDVFPGRSAAPPALSWLNGFFSASGFPPNGIAIGQKWKTERPVPGAPLSGLTWRADSSYLRNEPCDSSGGASASGSQAGAAPGECAVILTRSEILQRGSRGADATPEDYLRNGLRTSGTWTGSGEGLDSISLASGLLVSSTQTSKQDMDYEITSARTGSAIHHVGQVQSQSQITLVPESQ
jgi:hypothetical protein